MIWGAEVERQFVITEDEMVRANWEHTHGHPHITTGENRSQGRVHFIGDYQKAIEDDEGIKRPGGDPIVIQPEGDPVVIQPGGDPVVIQPGGVLCF